MHDVREQERLKTKELRNQEKYQDLKTKSKEGNIEARHTKE